jgi:hypothetical protein
MIQIDCSGCTNHCCGKNPNLTPVLLPCEEDDFQDSSKCVKTPYGEVRILRKKDDGNCIFLDQKTTKCTIYNTRPLECRLYPLLLDFSKAKPDVKLDTRFCPHLHNADFNQEEIADLIQRYSFPKDWIKAYESLADC